MGEDFSPITRGEAIDLVAGILRTTDEGTFEGEDLSNLEYLVSLELISGYPDGTYRLENELTRGEMAAILFKCLEN